MQHLSRRDFFKRGGAAAASLAALESWALAAPTSPTPDPARHLLNRLSYGPRPDEVARARALGLEAFLDEQLWPESLDDAELDRRLKRLPILNMDRRTLYSLQDYQGRCYRTLVEAAVLRAAYSRRQLFERMVEFWSDHFNVPADFDITPDLVLMQREVIRVHALGTFRDLLLGVAKSPAMLYYLDNDRSVKDHPNENWARELLELHTLGVDGGYTERDVKAVARAFTGWTTHDRTEDGFYFNLEQHDTDEKTILGHHFPEGRGLEDGLHVLGLLANHPETARFVSTKLCRRFVSDRPDPALVEELVRVWQETGGQIRPVIRALFLSDAFDASAGQKLRRPFDFFVGAMRTTGTEVLEFWLLEEMLSELGQVPYGWQPPNGYPDAAGAWLSTSGLLSRWNTAMRLSHGAYSDPDWNWGLLSCLEERVPQVVTVTELVAAVSEQVFGAVLDDQGLEPFIQYASDGAGGLERVTPHLLGRKLGSLYGLMLASPQYQWR